MDRYSRQELVYGKEAQKQIKLAKVAIIGLGGTGTHIADTLVRAGIGNILLVDRDVIDESNLQRQTLYKETDVGKPKALAAKERLIEINSHIKIDSLVEDINPKTVLFLRNYDFLIDATDNMGTRMILNEFAKVEGSHFIYSAAIKENGLVAFFSPQGACLSCIIPNPQKGGDTCDILGVTGPTVAIIGQLAAHEVLNYLAGRFKDTKLVSVNLKEMKFSASLVERRKNCPVCNGIYKHLDEKKKLVEEICGSGYQFNPEKDYNLDLYHLKEHLKKHAEYKIKSYSKDVFVIQFKGREATIFKTGRMIIKGVTTEREAKSFASKIISL